MFTNAITTVTKIGKTLGRQIVGHAPTIFKVSGAVCSVGAVISACKTTYTRKDEIEEAKVEVNELKASKIFALESGDEDFDIWEYRKKLTKAEFKYFIKLIKIYGLTVALEIMGLYFSLKAYNLVNDKYLGALATCLATEKSFKDYRDRVVEQLGEDADFKFMSGITEKVIEEPVLDKKGNVKTDKNGVVKTEKKIVSVLDEYEDNPHVLIFDERSRCYNDDPMLDREFLASWETEFTRRLIMDGHLWKNEVRSQLGFVEEDNGQDTGWTYNLGNPNSDGCVCFGPSKRHGMFKSIIREDGKEIFVIFLNDEGYIRNYVFSDGSSEAIAKRNRRARNEA